MSDFPQTCTRCSVEGCENTQIVARKLCKAHYERWRRHGNPIGGGTARGEAQRWLREVALLYTRDECIAWPYSRLPNGYGHIQFDGKSACVSRVICEEINGPPPSLKYDAAHSCGNGHLACCTPRHLRWATHVENMADCLKHGTHNYGERSGTSKLTEADVLEIRAMEGIISQQKIADQFGVSFQHVSRIHRRTRWEYLK